MTSSVRHLQVEPCVLSVESLVAAIVEADGDALVMHVGEQPTVLTRQGSLLLPFPALTLDVMDHLLGRMLPSDALQALQEYGAVEADLGAQPAAGPEHFTVIAARGGEDIWLELRRQRTLPFEFPPEPRAASDSGAFVAQGGCDAPPPIHSARFDAAKDGERSGRVVLPLTRGVVRPESGRVAGVVPRMAELNRLLRTAATRGAETLYLFSQARPAVRVDGEITVLDGESVLAASDVEALLLEAVPDRCEGESERSEWIVDRADVGRVRCVSFRDHRGPGGVFRMIPAQAISADQLGLSREIQSLCAEPEGLLLVVGPRASGKSTLLAALVDLVNRTRNDHVITLESRIKVVHESHSSLVSQREVRGDPDALVAEMRAALRENPDVLVIEDCRAPEVVTGALEAASSGHLVIAAMAAQSAATAIERIVDQMPPERRVAVQALLAESLRGVVGQVLLRKAGGGRVAARELLLNSSPVAQLIAEGKMSQLPAAMESGRRLGMVPMTDALVAFVQSGAVDGREAYRKAADRPALLKTLRREGLDTSFAERFA